MVGGVVALTVIEAKRLQPLKADSPILVTLLGIVIDEYFFGTAFEYGQT